MNRENEAVIIGPVKTCLICSSKINDTLLGHNNKFGKKESELTHLCKIFNIPFVNENDIFIQTEDNNDIQETGNPSCCIFCRTHITEFFRIENQIRELVKQLEKLKCGIGSLIVESFSATSPSIKHYSLKRKIYEVWFSRASYRGILSSVNQETNSMNGQAEQIPIIIPKIPPPPYQNNIDVVQLSNSENVAEPAEDDNNNSCTPMPSPSSVVGEVDSEFENMDEDSTQIASGEKNVEMSSSAGDNLNDHQDMDKTLNVVEEQQHDLKGDPVPNGRQQENKKRYSHAEIFRCPYCGIMKKDKSNFDGHIRSHTGEKPLQCRLECGRGFSQHSNRSKHEKKYCLLRFEKQVPTRTKKASNQSRTDKTVSSTSSETKSHKCPYCEKFWKNAFTLKLHIRVHTGEKPFKCKLCDRRFADSGNRSKHEKNHDQSRLEGEPKYPCEICGKKFRVYVTLYHHRRYTHFGISQYPNGRSRQRNRTLLPRVPCPHCGKILVNKWQAQRHIARIHQGREYAWKCEICGKPCITRGRAKSHENTHKPNRMHERLFQYKCKECPNHLGFSRKDTLRQHLSINHPNVPQPDSLKSNRKRKKRTLHPCTKCPAELKAIFSKGLYLRKHMEKHHSGSNPPPYLGRKVRSNISNKKSSKDVDDETSTSSESDEEYKSAPEITKTMFERNLRKRNVSKSKMSSSYAHLLESSDEEEIEYVSKEQGQYKKSNITGIPDVKKSKILMKHKPINIARRKEKIKLINPTTNPLQLKTLKIHLTRVDDPNILQSSKITENIKLEEIKIVAVQSLADETQVLSKSKLRLPSISQIASILGSSSSSVHP